MKQFVQSLAITMLLFSAPSFAAVYCVSTSTELQQALSAAAASAADDEIRIRQGTYIHTASFIYNSQNTAWISISGGYFTVDANLCGGKFSDVHGGFRTQSRLMDVGALENQTAIFMTGFE